MNQKPAGSPRQRAACILAEWLATRVFPECLLASVAADRPFISQVVYGVARRKRTLEWIIRRLSPGAPEPSIAPFLMAGAYELLFMRARAPYAVIDESVEAVKKTAGRKAAGFANALLRRLLREKVAVSRELESQPLGVRESHPDILVNRWLAEFGDARTELLCKWNNLESHTTIRPNTLKIAMPDLRRLLEQAGIHAVTHRLKPAEFLVLPRGVRVPDVPGYAEGLFTIQDPSTTRAVELLEPAPGQAVLDACAAPGGKTALLAQAMRDTGKLIAADMSEERLAMLRENVERLGLTCVKVAACDMSDPSRVRSVFADARFDRILLDAPCTNTGVLRSRPDARWRFSSRFLARAAKLQLALLDSVATLLKNGGRLVFATCSLEQEEGRMLIARWLNRNREFRLEKDVAVFPPEAEADGMYAAALVRAGQRHP